VGTQKLGNHPIGNTLNQDELLLKVKSLISALVHF